MELHFSLVLEPHGIFIFANRIAYFTEEETAQHG
jgi:hypothetical protein